MATIHGILLPGKNQEQSERSLTSGDWREDKLNQEQETARKAFIGVIADTIASLCMEAARHTAKEQDGSGMKLKEPGKENSGRTETGCRQVSGSRDGYNS